MKIENKGNVCVKRREKNKHLVMSNWKHISWWLEKLGKKKEL